MKIDCRGHSMHEPGVEDCLKREIQLWGKLFADKPEGLSSFLSQPFYVSFECHSCGESPHFLSTDRGESFTAETECPYKDGFPPIEVNLEVPSGEILLFNDFRHHYQEEKDYININNTYGIKLYTEHYAKQGMVTHFVGNSCPRVVQVSDERLEIGSFYCEKEDGCKLPECPMPECNKVKELGSICTDLWWYCAVDRAEFEKRIGKTTDEYEKEYHATGCWPDVIRAKVIPGTYRTIGQYHIDSDRLYSYIERVK